MLQISTQEFERLPLRAHNFLAGVPLHDAWVVDLLRTSSGITLDEFLRTASARSQAGCEYCENDRSRKGSLLTGSPVVRALLNIRFFAGRLLGWDREPASTVWETFTTRLTTADRSKSFALAGTREGLFRVVYRFENEQLLELINRTAHAAAVSALAETANDYRFNFGVYVQNVGRFTPVYMALVDPFRQLIVYPSLLRSVRGRWNQALGTDCSAARARNSGQVVKIRTFTYPILRTNRKYPGMQKDGEPPDTLSLSPSGGDHYGSHDQ